MATVADQMATAIDRKDETERFANTEEDEVLAAYGDDESDASDASDASAKEVVEQSDHGQDEQSDQADQSEQSDQADDDGEEVPEESEEESDAIDTTESDPDSPNTQAELTEEQFPLTIRLADPTGKQRDLTFETLEDYQTFVDNADNLTKAWAATHERNRKLKAERMAVDEWRKKMEDAEAPKRPGDIDLSKLDPNEESYDPKAGLSELKSYLTQVVQWADRVATTPAPNEPADPIDALKNEIAEAERQWFESQTLTEDERARVEAKAEELAIERMNELKARGRTVRPEFDVPDIYDRARREVLGAPKPPTPDPSKSVRDVIRVTTVAKNRSKTAPKKSRTNAPAREVDPFSDDVSQKEFDRLLAEGKIDI